MFAWISLALCVVSMIVFVVVKVTRGGITGVVAKTGASLIFVISGLVALITNDLPLWAYFIIAGLVLGMVGDILLGLFERDIVKPHSRNLLNFGMLAFGVGHICYMTALAFNSLQYIDIVLVPLALAVAIGCIVALLLYVNSGSLGLKFGIFKYQSLAYSAVLCSALVYSLFISVLTKTMWLPVIALALFLASDLILSLMYFGDKNSKQMDIANKVTYYLAQIMFVAYLFFFI